MNDRFQIVGVNSSKVLDPCHRNNLLRLLGGSIDKRLIDPENTTPSRSISLIVLEPRRGRRKMRFRLVSKDGSPLDQGNVESMASCGENQKVFTVSGGKLFGYEFRVLAK